MTRINFNRYSSGSFGSGGGGTTLPAGSAPQPELPFALLHRIANHGARLAAQRIPLSESTQVDGLPVMRSGPLNAWAAEIGWREGEHMRLHTAAAGAVEAEGRNAI